ncbi:hypothetical protein [Xanthomonas sacchari]|uniref:hypothetical protein n=1 Tax=Xanthomonas sacchari TaxID=56458 RepID=UPI002253D66E|nr:hypothetical protein [Xanthomonas sacchari]
MIEQGTRFQEGMLYGRLLVLRGNGWVRVPFEIALPDDVDAMIEDVEVYTAASGTHIMLETKDEKKRRYLMPVHRIVAEVKAGLRDEERDLNVLYIGQAIGSKKPRSAIDRLRRHETFQAILADYHTYHPGREILLLLYRFENWRVLISTGGDLRLSPVANEAQERAHLRRMSEASLNRKECVSLAEAALINHFKPLYNKVFKKTDFSLIRRIKTLKSALREDLTGLVVEICSMNVGGRLRTEGCAPGHNDILDSMEAGIRDRVEEGVDAELYQEMCSDVSRMKHTHFARFALTTIQERETFLHGIVWLDSDERVPFL